MLLTIAVLTKTNKVDRKFIDRLLFADEVIFICSDIISGLKNKGKIKYFSHPLANDFSNQRNFAISKAKGDWVLFVDTDEVISSHLAKEIISAIHSNSYNGYYIKRIDTIFHQAQLHGESGNTKIVRLAKKTSGKFVRSVHELWKIKGKIGELQNPLFHTKDHFISEFLDRIYLYGPIDAINLNREHKPFNFLRLLAYPKAKFLQNYFVRSGYLDGYPGLFQSYLMSVQSLSVRIFQWSLQKRSIV